MLTCAEVAERLKVSRQFVRDEIAAHRLPAYRLGARAIRIKKEDLAEYIEKRESSRQIAERHLD